MFPPTLSEINRGAQFVVMVSYFTTRSLAELVDVVRKQHSSLLSLRYLKPVSVLG